MMKEIEEERAGIHSFGEVENEILDLSIAVEKRASSLEDRISKLEKARSDDQKLNYTPHNQYKG